MNIEEEANKILLMVVEDEAAIGRQIIKLTEMHFPNIKTLFVTSSTEAIEIWKKEPHHILITDILMPEINGIELTKKILALNPNTKCIVITGGGKSNEEIVKQILLDAAASFGALQTLAKPFQWTALKESIERALSSLDQSLE